jgi:hypothetical protein
VSDYFPPHTAPLCKDTLLFLLLSLDLDDLDTLVVATGWAHMMRESQLVTLWARYQLDLLQRQVASTPIPPALGDFPFW